MVYLSCSWAMSFIAQNFPIITLTLLSWDSPSVWYKTHRSALKYVKKLFCPFLKTFLSVNTSISFISFLYDRIFMSYLSFLACSVWVFTFEIVKTLELKAENELKESLPGNHSCTTRAWAKVIYSVGQLLLRYVICDLPPPYLSTCWPVYLFTYLCDLYGFFLLCQRITPLVLTIFQFFYKEQVLLLFSEKSKIMLFCKS